MKIMLIIAMLGHILCCVCDNIITYTPNGRFGLADLKDNNKLSARFENMNTSRQINSMLWGIPALMMQACGYFAIADNIRTAAPTCAMVMAAGAVIYLASGVAHHIICGLIEWFYIRFGRTEEARVTVLDFFKKTSVTMVACYVGLIMASVTLFAAVVTGGTTAPVWVCVFNTVIFYIVLSPFRIVGAGNIAGALTFLGLALFM